jgi:transposase
MSDTVFTHVPKLAEIPARRIEVFTGAGRRRNWSAEEKAAIIAESYDSGDTVCAVARRHGLTHSQLFAWRRQARRSLANERAKITPWFVPAVMDSASSPVESSHREKRSKSRLSASGTVEVAIGNATLRAGPGADADLVAAMIRALKAGA